MMIMLSQKYYVVKKYPKDLNEKLKHFVGEKIEIVDQVKKMDILQQLKMEMRVATRYPTIATSALQIGIGMEALVQL